MKNAILVGVVIASGLVGCGQAGEPSWGPERSGTTSQELGSVRDCVSQAVSCANGATSASAATSCEQDLRSCLASLAPDGAVPPVPSFDAGSLLPPGFDAGSLPPIANVDAGSLPPLPDAGLPQLPDGAVPPVGSLDAAIGALDGAKACVDTLQACLASSTDPLSCAQQAVTCLDQVL